MFLELNTYIFTSRNVFFAYFVDVLFGSCSLQIRLVIAFFFTFLNLRYTELLFQIWYQMQIQNHFAVQSFIASNWSWFLSSHFQFTIFVYLVRINVSFKDIWKRLSVCLKKKWIFDVSEHSSLSTGNATKWNVSRNKVASESNHALSYVLDRVFHVNVVQERYQWRRYGWRNVFIVAFINLSQQTVLVHDNYKSPDTEICKTY